MQGLEWRPGLLGAVEHDLRAGGWRQSRQDLGGREGSVEAQSHQADPLACGVERIDRLARCTGARTHDHQHPLGIGRAVVLGEPVLTTGDGSEAVHRRLHLIGNSVVERVAGLACLEEHVGVLGAAAQHGTVRIEPATEVGGDRRLVDQGPQLFGSRYFDGVQLMAGAEAIEEVQERHAGRERRGMGHGRHIGRFLHGTGAEHGEARGAGGHDIAVITEDAEGMGGHGTGCHMDDGGGEFPGDLEHLGQHQQQALAGRERGGQRTAEHRSVKGTGRTGLALHLDHLGHHAPKVRTPPRAPFVGMLAHRRGRGDGIDGDHLGEQVGHPGHSFVGIDYFASAEHDKIRIGTHDSNLRSRRPI